MTTNSDLSLLKNFLTRGVEKVFPAAEYLEARLKEGNPLTMYLGIDPTGPTLHLGHAIVLRKMAEFQKLGHKIVLLIGDFTGMIGDPTDKSAARVRLTREQVLENAKLYKKQTSKIISFSGENKAVLKYNSKWLAKMNLENVVGLAAHFTVQQMLERDMFSNRVKERKPIYLHEFLYPLMQGYDSVAMNVDGEIGGNDQTFNMLAGRTLMKEMLQKEKFVMATKLLVDATGKKMGKTENNMVTLADSADDMYGKIMSWPDGLILPGFELLTDVALIDVEEGLKKGDNPRDWKARLAQEVVAFFHSKKAARVAQRNFENLFREHETPTEVPVYQTDKEKINILDLLVESGLVMSKGEARRLMDGGGIYMNNETLKDYNLEVAPTAAGILLQKGKRFFVRVVKK